MSRDVDSHFAAVSPFALLALIIFGLVVGTLASEAGLRLAGYYRPPLYDTHPTLGWVLRPHIRFQYHEEGRSLVSTNAAGFRDVEHSLAKPAHTYRLAVLGDSYAEALHVEADSSFWGHLRQLLRPCIPAGQSLEVLNFGVGGYSTAQESIVYSQVARRYGPDMVLLAFTTTNDFVDNPGLAPFPRPFYRLAGDSLVLDVERVRTQLAGGRARHIYRVMIRHSRLLQLLRSIYQLRLDRRFLNAEMHLGHDTIPARNAGLDVQAFADHPDSAWQAGLRVTDRILGQLAHSIAADSARFVVVTLSAVTQVHPDRRVRAEFMRLITCVTSSSRNTYSTASPKPMPFPLATPLPASRRSPTAQVSSCTDSRIRAGGLDTGTIRDTA